jgi:glycosyltransferase involved in cell wall biosynthesis
MGGPVVIAGLITALSKHERIALLYLRGEDEPAIDPRVAEACDVAIEVTRPGKRSGAANALSALRGVPRWVSEWRVPAYESALRSLVQEWQPEVIQAEFHLMCQYLATLRRDRPPVTLNQHEPGAAAIADRRRARLLRGRVMPMLEERAWRQYERRLRHHVDAVVVFSERDQRAMRELCPRTRIEIISPGTRIVEPALNPTGEGEPSLLFFGNYVHTPNVDAALRLAKDIFPPIRQEAPDARLWMLGDRPPQELQQLSDACIWVPGRVDTLAPYLDAAAAVIAPIRLGGGMRVKVIETLAAGKALIASPVALAGLDVVDGKHALIAETDEEFARAARWLLEHPVERAALARRGREWASRNLSWDRAARQYAALHADLLRQRAERRR